MMVTLPTDMKGTTMSREVRRVPLGWQHPMEWREQWEGSTGSVRMQLVPRPLFDRSMLDYRDEEDGAPDPDDYMPEFAEGSAVGWCMYETTSEGTPISPVFETPEELARWLAYFRVSTFGTNRPVTYDQWLRMIQAGWAPSAVAVGGVLSSGVEFVSRSETTS